MSISLLEFGKVLLSPQTLILPSKTIEIHSMHSKRIWTQCSTVDMLYPEIVARYISGYTIHISTSSRVKKSDSCPNRNTCQNRQRCSHPNSIATTNNAS